MIIFFLQRETKWNERKTRKKKLPFVVSSKMKSQPQTALDSFFFFHSKTKLKKEKYFYKNETMCVGGYLLNIHDPSFWNVVRCHRIKNKSKTTEVAFKGFKKMCVSDEISFLSLPFVEIKAQSRAKLIFFHSINIFILF